MLDTKGHKLKVDRTTRASRSLKPVIVITSNPSTSDDFCQSEDFSKNTRSKSNSLCQKTGGINGNVLNLKNHRKMANKVNPSSSKVTATIKKTKLPSDIKILVPIESSTKKTINTPKKSKVVMSVKNEGQPKIKHKINTRSRAIRIKKGLESPDYDLSSIHEETSRDASSQTSETNQAYKSKKKAIESVYTTNHLAEQGSNYKDIENDLLDYSSTTAQEITSAKLEMANKNSEFLINRSKEYEKLFIEYYIEMKANFNLVFYGFGSKLQLIKKFCNSYLLDCLKIYVNGNDEELSNDATEIFKAIYNWLSYQETTRFGENEYKSLKDKLKKNKAVLIIYNFENFSFKLNNNKKHAKDVFYDYLLDLTENNLLNIIIALENPMTSSSFLLANIKNYCSYKFVFHEISTFVPYIMESTHIPQFYNLNNNFYNNAESYIDSAKMVINSCTQNAQQIFKILLDHQIQTNKNEASGEDCHQEIQKGIEYEQLFKLSREQFLCRDIYTFNNSMVEFIDHKIIIKQRCEKGEETLFIPLEAEHLVKLKEAIPLVDF